MKKLILPSLLIALLLGGCSLKFPEARTAKKILGPEQAKAVAEKFINENLLPESTKATVKNITDEGDVYNVNLEVEGKDYTSYMTKDGAKFFQSGIDMEKMAQENKAQNQDAAVQAETVVPKSDKPKVELFVMTHCPYGLQAEKGILPAFKALGDKIGASIKFVHYFMHGDKEEQETYNQICVREEQPAKFNAYLDCFAIEGDSAKCLDKAGIDKAKLNSCVKSKAKDMYKADSDLSQKYGVEGSPTLIINGVKSEVGRDAASYLAGICAAFNSAPSQCSEKLSSSSPSAGFGAGSDDSGSADAGCGQ